MRKSKLSPPWSLSNTTKGPGANPNSAARRQWERAITRTHRRSPGCDVTPISLPVVEVLWPGESLAKAHALILLPFIQVVLLTNLIAAVSAAVIELPK